MKAIRTLVVVTTLFAMGSVQAATKPAPGKMTIKAIRDYLKTKRGDLIVLTKGKTPVKSKGDGSMSIRNARIDIRSVENDTVTLKKAPNTHMSDMLKKKNVNKKNKSAYQNVLLYFDKKVGGKTHRFWVNDPMPGAERPATRGSQAVSPAQKIIDKWNS